MLPVWTVGPGQYANTCEPASQSADLDVNNVRTKLLNGGDMWWDISNPKYEIPKINDPNAVRKHAMFAGAIWIGGRDNGGSLKLAAMTYRQKGVGFLARSAGYDYSKLLTPFVVKRTTKCGR
jgi:hypothetical protein